MNLKDTFGSGVVVVVVIGGLVEVEDVVEDVVEEVVVETSGSGVVVVVSFGNNGGSVPISQVHPARVFNNSSNNTVSS